MNTFNWQCPHCSQHVTVTNSDRKVGVAMVEIDSAAKNQVVGIKWIACRCPNPDCMQITLDIGAGFGAAGVVNHSYSFLGKFVGVVPVQPVGIGHFRFSPRVGIPLSKHVPSSISEDYAEACTIKDLSPKAAATLCRRALQGMVRNFWTVSDRTLHAELLKIEPQCDSELFKALMAIKSIGNIGAHPEVDISTIVDVEPGEVDTLIEVLQILDEEWYVARANRVSRLSAVHALGAEKAAAIAGSKPTGAAVPVLPSEL